MNSGAKRCLEADNLPQNATLVGEARAMPYFPDLSPECIRQEPNTFCVGWLDPDYPYPRGKTPPGFEARLAALCETDNPEYLSMGYHLCLFCGRVRGNGEFRIASKTRNFAAPVLIHHYVKEHDYKPPEEFIEAVMARASGVRRRVQDKFPRGPRLSKSELERQRASQRKFNAAWLKKLDEFMR